MNAEAFGGTCGVCLIIGAVMAVVTLGWAPLIIMVPAVLVGSYVARHLYG